MLIRGQDLRLPVAVGRLENGPQAVRCGLIRSEEAEAVRIRTNDVAQILAEHPRRLAEARRRLGHPDRVVAEVRELEALEQQSAVGVWAGAHALLATGRQLADLGSHRPTFVKELVRAVGAHPRFKGGELLRIAAYARQRDLM